MKHCVQYPDDKFLAVRPCLVAICFGNRPAAKLLGTLLYRYNLRVENKDDAENQNAIKAAKGEKPDQDTTYRIFRRQAQLVEDMCGEITEKTLHDVAVPMLQLLGCLDIEEHMQSNCYIVNIEQVQEALNLYVPTAKEQPQLEDFLINHIQLEKFLISTNELEKFLIDKKNFLSGLEKVLIYNRNISNLKRGPKVSAEAVSKPVFHDPQNTKEESKKNNKKEDSCAIAPVLSDEDVSFQETVKVPAMPKKLPAVKSENDTHFQLSSNGDTPAKRKPAKPKEELSPEDSALAARCSSWYKRITEWCGGPLSKGGAVMNEHRCIKLLCQRYSDAQIDAIFAYLTTKDWKWSKVDNKFNVRGYILESEAGRVARILEEAGKPNKPVSNNTSAYAERPTALVSVEQAKINRERRDARIAALTAAGGR
jgi:hypothetical protein